ncbi:MAG: carboxymuconolactone decarboxylase family protein [Lysobacterales bacterium]
MQAPQLHRVPVAEMPEDLQPIWQQLNALTGNAQFVEVFANAPELLTFVMRDFYANVFFAGRLNARAKQLARLRLSLVHGCRTCNRQNKPGAKEAGITPDEITALEEGDLSQFSPADRAVLAFTELMTLQNLTEQVPPSLMADLKIHFSDAEICELGVVTAFVAGFAKLSFVLDLVDKEDNCSFV